MTVTTKESKPASVDSLQILQERLSVEMQRHMDAVAEIQQEMRDATREGARSLMEGDDSKAAAGVPGFEGQNSNDNITPNSLSDAERTALFDGLRETLAMKENCEGAPDMSVIEAALMKNPTMMFNLKRLQDAGAKLVVTGFQEGQYVELADAAQNLDIRKQEAGLAGLTEQERNDAIETIVAPIADDAQKAPARDWLLSQLRRSNNARGLNFAEALVYAVAHGGTLISHAAYDAWAKKDPSVYEDKTWTWYFKSLADVMKIGIAPVGLRRGGWAFRGEGVADGRGGNRGVRVAGLRVQIS